MCKLFLFVLLLTLAVSAFADIFGDDLPRGTIQSANARDYIDLRDLALTVIDRYPPSQFYYVGLGRSPTPLMAMIQAILGDSSGCNIPISDMRNLQPADMVLLNGEKPKRPEEWEIGLTVEERRQVAKEQTRLTQQFTNEQTRLLTYTPETRARFQKHIRMYLALHREQIANRQILFLDWAGTGATAINFVREINSFPETENISFKFLALTHGLYDVAEKLGQNGITPFVVSKETKTIFDLRLYRDFAEYDQYSIEVRSPTGQPMNDQELLPRRTREYLQNAERESWGDRSKYKKQQKMIEGWVKAIRSYDDLRDSFRLHVSRDYRVASFKVANGLETTKSMTPIQRLRYFCAGIFH